MNSLVEVAGLLFSLDISSLPTLGAATISEGGSSTILVNWIWFDGAKAGEGGGAAGRR